MTKKPAPAYRVEVENARCKTCGLGEQWWIIGPGEIAQGRSYHDEIDALEDCGALNNAFDLGRKTQRNLGDVPPEPAPPKDTIGGRIKAERTKNRCSQGLLGNAINMAASSISDFENGKTDPPIGKLKLIAAVLRVPWQSLIPEET